MNTRIVRTLVSGLCTQCTRNQIPNWRAYTARTGTDVFGDDHLFMVENHRIHYKKCGEGEHVLLLMPGVLGMGKIDFHHQLLGLDRKKFTMIAWDAPGTGQSRPPIRKFLNAYRRDARLAARLMQSLNYNRYSVLGWDDGGRTAMVLTGANSHSIRKLIIWGCNAYVTHKDKSQMLKSPSPYFDQYVKIYGENTFNQLWSSFAMHYITMKDICIDDLDKIYCPVLVVHGDQDDICSSEHPIFLINNLNNSTLYRFNEGGHQIHQQYPEEFNTLVEDFLTS